eukprot:75297-Chlamydomonas_euryale.AAC.2
MGGRGTWGRTCGARVWEHGDAHVVHECGARPAHMPPISACPCQEADESFPSDPRRIPGVIASDSTAIHPLTDLRHASLASHKTYRGLVLYHISYMYILVTHRE